MKRYNIMFRNGDGISIHCKEHTIDEHFLTLWGERSVVAKFHWGAIVGFTITEDGDGK